MAKARIGRRIANEGTLMHTVIGSIVSGKTRVLNKLLKRLRDG